jgi:beta-glucosidase
MDMVGEGFLTTLKKSLQEKKITAAEIDLACRRLLEAKYSLGLFEDPYRYINQQRATREVLSADKRAAAREFAAKSCVLLKNSGNALPLKKSGTIALIGPLANERNNMLGTWAVSGDAQTATPILDGMKTVGGNNVQILMQKAQTLPTIRLWQKWPMYSAKKFPSTPANHSK